ncbi:unnamed protein product (macronuclear) [Paramecium tetraurelia]|uniref:Uncharacterized protein n=1 Tax=Paramecium tetraurelia TaxID=5888 RepID=A0BKT7_PARTE|nr:uncharacterized protein GSPATT00029785001 [Paramecium tetraurelia]CAK59154.1 unnamed protein product [Paramecium tetraurelia]|eukprot:XP_001426552.1 hypothetical protein (macronuclear) [Paramecium tetraurelia strain d4-2]
MISEFDILNYYPLQLYDLQMPMTSQLEIENFNENECSARKLRVSSQCLILKKYKKFNVLEKSDISQKDHRYQKQMKPPGMLKFTALGRVRRIQRIQMKTKNKLMTEITP